MKRYLILLSILLTTCWESHGQTLTTDPAEFTPDDEVTFTFDVTGSTMEGYNGDAYVWAWNASPGGKDAPSNVDPPTDAAAPAMLTRSVENPNIYTITFIPKDFFAVSSTELTKMGILAKGISFGNKTPDFLIDLLPPVFSSPVVRVFPTQVTSGDIVTVFYDTNLEEDAAMKAAGDYYLYVTIEGSDVNGGLLDPDDYLLPIDSKTKLISIGGGKYRITFIPERFFALNPGDTITKIMCRVQNEDGSLTNPPAGFDLINVTVRKGVE